jgi:RimJ/RimL family protein N-acetyltransferase
VDVYLDTERLALRRFTADDADLLIELDSDPAVMRYLTGGEPTAPEVIREGHLPSILAGYDKWGGQLGLFAAHEKDAGAFIGWFTVRPEPDGPANEVELGYRLRQAAWGRGYATEGSRALVRRAFTELGVSLVWAETMTVNHGSRAVLDKLGMTLVDSIPTPPDMLMVEGAEAGGVRYEITEEQWLLRQGSAPGAPLEVVRNS